MCQPAYTKEMLDEFDPAWADKLYEKYGIAVPVAKEPEENKNADADE
jgi:hypothetical protein